MPQVINVPSASANILRTVWDPDTADTISLVSCVVTEVNGSAPGSQPAWFTNVGFDGQTTENGKAKRVHTATVNFDAARAAGVNTFKYQITATDGSANIQRTFTVTLDDSARSPAGAVKVFFKSGQSNHLYSFDLTNPQATPVQERAVLNSSGGIRADRQNQIVLGQLNTANSNLNRAGFADLSAITQIQAELPNYISIAPGSSRCYHRRTTTTGLFRSNYDGSSNITLTPTDFTNSFRGIAVDEENGFLYAVLFASPWTVRRWTLADLTQYSDILTLSSTTNARDIALDPVNNYLILGRRGSSPSSQREIWRYDWNRAAGTVSNGTLIHTDAEITTNTTTAGIPEGGLDVDPVGGVAFWSSPDVRKIKKVPYLGTGPWTAVDVLQQTTGAPQALGLVVN